MPQKMVPLESLGTVSLPVRIPNLVAYHFIDKARYWSKITISSYPCIRRTRSPSEYCHNVCYGKLELRGLLGGEKVW